MERRLEGKVRDWDRESRAAPSELREVTQVTQVVDGLRKKRRKRKMSLWSAMALKLAMGGCEWEEMEVMSVHVCAGVGV